MTILWILLAIVVVVGLWLISTYNGLIQLRNQTDEAWSDIDVQLKRRYDLIPNLVNTIKGYTTHESGVFQQVSEARSAALNAKSLPDKAAAENMLSSTLKSSSFRRFRSLPELKQMRTLEASRRTLRYRK